MVNSDIFIIETLTSKLDWFSIHAKKKQFLSLGQRILFPHKLQKSIKKILYNTLFICFFSLLRMTSSAETDLTSSASSDVCDAHTFYNNPQEHGLDRRNESKIVHMRNFNNWIKSTLISRSYFLESV